LPLDWPRLVIFFSNCFDWFSVLRYTMNLV
jgi:hypothetical protein